jgi:hypothetical protein
MHIRPNPLNVVTVKNQTNNDPRPQWVCKHPDAKVIDYENRRFSCFICNPKKGVIRRMPVEELLKNVRKYSE